MFAASKQIGRSSTTSYLVGSVIWLINSISNGALLKWFRSTAIYIMVVFYHWKTAEVHFQRNNRELGAQHSL